MLVRVVCTWYVAKQRRWTSTRCPKKYHTHNERTTDRPGCGLLLFTAAAGRDLPLDLDLTGASVPRPIRCHAECQVEHLLVVLPIDTAPTSSTEWLVWSKLAVAHQSSAEGKIGQMRDISHSLVPSSSYLVIICRLDAPRPAGNTKKKRQDTDCV